MILLQYRETKMTKNNLTINVGSLVEGIEGESVKINIDEKIRLEEKNMPALMHIKAKLTIMKLGRELNVSSENLETIIEVTCSRCLKTFKHKIEIPFMERQFLFERPHNTEDLDDLYLVDMKNMTIDLKELFRQEILLHFPLNPLCSLKCKGLCSVCGINLNEKDCGHISVPAPDIIKEHKPMSHLKELFNSSQNGKTSGTKEKSSAKSDKKTL